MPERNFPEGFIWGTATAAVQVEGYPTADGGGENVWCAECRKPGKITNDDTMEIACDQYHRYKEDIALMRECGIKAYRFSMSWPRIFPEGDGKPNLKGLDYYNRLIDELLANGIEPWVTMYHWDLPVAMQERFGGWLSRKTPELFAEYCGYAAGKISDRVKHFFTVNEIVAFTSASYNTAGGRTAPSVLCTRQQEEQTVFHGCLAHGLGMQAIRANSPAGVQVGIAQNPEVAVPLFESEANIAAARKATRYLNRSMLTMIMEGAYPEEYLREVGPDAPHYTDSDLKVISEPMDILGLNIYTAAYAAADDADAPGGFRLLPRQKDHPRMNIDWEYIVPETLYWGLRYSNELWHPRALMISENGAAARDSREKVSGEVVDTARIMYLREYMQGVQRAAAEGIPVKGYFLWSFLDNFEWNNGYEPRFGLVYVDRSTLARTPKRSFDYYAETIRRNALV